MVVKIKDELDSDSGIIKEETDAELDEYAD
jgi:hypothetical protein